MSGNLSNARNFEATPEARRALELALKRLDNALRGVYPSMAYASVVVDLGDNRGAGPVIPVYTDEN